MPTPLKGQTPAATYNKLLVIDNSGTGLVSGLDSSLRAVLDGSGAQTPLQLSMSAVALNGLQWPSSGGIAGTVLRVSTTSGKLEWHTITSSDITTILGYVPANQASGSFSNPVQIKASTLDTNTTTVNANSTGTVYSFSSATGGSLKLVCQVKDTVTNAIHTEELLIVTDGSIVDYTGFGVVYTQASLGAFDVTMSGNNANVTFASTSSNSTTVKVVATSVTA